MKNTQFYKNNLNYYRSDRILKFIEGQNSRQDIDDYVSKTYSALPKYVKNVLNADKEKYINSLVNQIIQGGEIGEIRPYTALVEVGKTLSGRTPQAMDIYSQFRDEIGGFYSRYNSYLYRMGYSSADYFYKNAKYSAIGSIVEVTVELPDNFKKNRYEKLILKFDFSRGDFQSKMIKKQLT